MKLATDEQTKAIDVLDDLLEADSTGQSAIFRRAFALAVEVGAIDANGNALVWRDGAYG